MTTDMSGGPSPVEPIEGTIEGTSGGAAIVRINPAPVVTWTPEQAELIRRTIAPEATNDELALFMHVASKSGLDPLLRQIWFSKRKQNVGTRDKPRYEDRVLIMAGADGMQARALRFPDCTSIMHAAVFERDDFLFDRKTGLVVKHFSNPFKNAGNVIGAWAVVLRRDKDPFVALVSFDEYVDGASFLWRDKPAVMIEKVARATALRRAYPENFGGIYDPAELDRGKHQKAVEEAKENGQANGNGRKPPKRAERKPEPPREEPPPHAGGEPEPKAGGNPEGEWRPLPEGEGVAQPEEREPVDTREPEPQPLPQTPPTPPKSTVPPAVQAVWDRAGEKWGEEERGKRWGQAAWSVFDGRPPPTAKWTEAQIQAVESTLFPQDVPF